SRFEPPAAAEFHGCLAPTNERDDEAFPARPGTSINSRCTLLLQSYCGEPARAEFPPPHSITSSARLTSVAGRSNPKAFAVFMLMMSSYLLGACTGRSPGFSPLRMRST